MLPFVPVIQKEAWVQCENPNCGKWRKLPAGTHVDDNEPWYCYLNPDVTHNTCDAEEAEYDETTEIVIADANDTEEAARNRELIERLEASLAAAAANAPRGRGRGGRGGKKPGRGGRGRGKSTAAAGGYPPLQPGAYFDPAALRRSHRSFNDEDHEAGSDDEYIPSGFQAPPRQTRRQAAKSLQRLLDNRGSWDRNPSGPSTSIAIPTEAWEVLGQYSGADPTELAVAATDLASCAAYFDTETEDGKSLATDSDALARLAVTLAAAAGTIANEDVFVGADRLKLGLDNMNDPLPDPNGPLDSSGAAAAAHGDPMEAEQQQEQQQVSAMSPGMLAALAHTQRLNAAAKATT